MITTFRGYGHYKKDLLSALMRKFGRRPFTYKDATHLSEFEHRTFSSLCFDECIKKMEREKGQKSNGKRDKSVYTPMRYTIPSNMWQIYRELSKTK